MFLQRPSRAIIRLEKWESFEISVEMGSNCGLCLQMRRQQSRYVLCGVSLAAAAARVPHKATRSPPPFHV